MLANKIWLIDWLIIRSLSWSAPWAEWSTTWHLHSYLPQNSIACRHSNTVQFLAASIITGKASPASLLSHCSSICWCCCWELLVAVETASDDDAGWAADSFTSARTSFSASATTAISTEKKKNIYFANSKNNNNTNIMCKHRGGFPEGQSPIVLDTLSNAEYNITYL